MPRLKYSPVFPKQDTPSVNKEPPPAWEDGALLHDIPKASEILTQKLGKGYTARRIRSLINEDKSLVQGYHYFPVGKRSYKINIPRFIAWVLSP